ncbi:MAG: 2-phosphosulfolactate phosphatase [Chloroflexi bacterium HGW-Chloroflexi-6]|nr:MAG: 2-phosphosulfolactate phosphatase [Chloroflexi bacterium HGW-Chloroflexi-6]
MPHSPKIHYATLENCHEAGGAVVVIDVLRAFSTAAYAFGQGVERIFPVGEPHEALALREKIPNSLAVGEINGIPFPGFDMGNSPKQMLEADDLRGRTLVQRTSAGTQGLIRSLKAQTLLSASFVVARATADYLRIISADEITFVSTGINNNGRGDEDLACAEYIHQLLLGAQPDPSPYLLRVRTSREAALFLDSTLPQFPPEDVEHCTRLDHFNFAMPVRRENGYLVMRALHSKPDIYS